MVTGLSNRLKNSNDLHPERPSRSDNSVMPLLVRTTVVRLGKYWLRLVSILLILLLLRRRVLRRGSDGKLDRDRISLSVRSIESFRSYFLCF